MTKSFPIFFTFSLVFLLLSQYSLCETVKSGFVLENSSREVLFDINAEIMEKEVRDNYMTAKVTLINFGEPGEVETTVNYTITGSSGETVYEESEVVKVLTQKEFLKTFDMRGFGDDEYKIVMDLGYRGQVEPAKAEETFVVARESGADLSMFFATFGFILSASFFVYWKMNPKIEDSE